MVSMSIASGAGHLAGVRFAGSASDFGAGADRLQLCLMRSNESEAGSNSGARSGFVAADVAAAVSGNEDAFERLHDRYCHGLVRFFLKRTAGRIELADELSQKTWVLVWRALRAGRYDSARAGISTFIYAVGQNVWLQHRRSSASALVAGGDFEDFSGLVEASAEDPAGELAAAELLDALREAICSVEHENALTGAEREVVRGLQAGQSERGLADRLGVAASTVHSRKVSAFEKLRRILTQRGFAGSGASATRESGESEDGASPAWRVSRE